MFNQIQQILLNGYTVAIGIPIVLLFCGSVTKKISRGSGWERKDFYLGVELALAAMSSALLHIFDLAKLIQTSSSAPSSLYEKITSTASFLCVTFLILLFIVATHQDWAQKDGQKGQFLRLGLFTNALGFGLLFAFILFVKGV